MLHLAGKLPHRAALSEEENEAAEFLADRLRQYTPDVEIDRFTTVENPLLLFAAYYGEFLIVAVLAHVWPWVALAYGCGVFVAYLAEYLGYRVLSRFMPPYRSQNVVARTLAEQPDHLFIVMANYDSGRAMPHTHPDTLPLLRVMHLGVIVCMLMVIGSCVVSALGLVNPEMPFPVYVRWTAVGALLAAAATLLYSSGNPEETRGANTNGSGVCALLALAKQFHQAPLAKADLWLLATGAQGSWMAGIRHVLNTQRLDRRRTYLLNIESVGSGELFYLTREGTLAPMATSPAMRLAAEDVDGPFNARPATMTALPTAAQPALMRGYHALTVMGLDEIGLPVHWNDAGDTLAEVDEDRIANAAAFCEALLRRLEQNLP
jgi:hypothetical protein